MAKPKRPRSARREVDRVQAERARTRHRIARLEPGGSPDWPITVESAVLVERRALELKCTQCAENGTTADLDVNDHEARTVGDLRRRLVNAKCKTCGTVRPIWFAIVEPLEN
jgi:hypothetical protein